jgi:FADH2 O2-dependent halogenase
VPTFTTDATAPASRALIAVARPWSVVVVSTATVCTVPLAPIRNEKLPLPVATVELAAELRLDDGGPAWQRFLSLYPSIAAQFSAAQPTREFTWMPRLSWRVDRAADEGWAMLPSAAAFIDPLFSTGIPLTLLGIERMARILELANADVTTSVPRGALESYGAVTLAEADHTARFIAGCYAAFPRFDQFAAYSMFYFAAASFSEMARRLDAPARPRQFLCADHRSFGPATLALSPSTNAASSVPAYAREVASAVQCLNIAGLCDGRKRNWYGVEAEDAVAGAHKLGVTPATVATVLAGLGLSLEP